MNTNFSDQNQILGYPKYSSSHNIDLSKIVTLSALVEPDANISKLKEKIERLKFQIAGQQQEIFLLKKSKLRFSNSVALNEEVQLVKKINSDLRAKVLELSKSTRDYEIKLQSSVNETLHIEEKLRSVLQENIELKLQLYNNKNEEKNSRTSLMEKDKMSLTNEIQDLKKQVSLMRDHFEKSFISLTSNSRSNIMNSSSTNNSNSNNNNSSTPKWSVTKGNNNNDINGGNSGNSGAGATWSKMSQIHKSEIYEKLNNPIARPKKICGRLINKHLNKELSKTICCKSGQLSKTSSKKSNNSSMKSDSTDDTSEDTTSSSSSGSQSNQSNLSEKRSNLSEDDENQSNTSNTNSTPTIISNENLTTQNNSNQNNQSNFISAHNNNNNNNNQSVEKIIDTTNLQQLINETKSIEQIYEKLEKTTDLCMNKDNNFNLHIESSRSRTCQVKSLFEKNLDNEVD